MLCLIKILIKNPIVFNYKKNIKKNIFKKFFVSFRKKKNGRRPFAEIFFVQSPTREKPKSGVLEKNIDF